MRSCVLPLLLAACAACQTGSDPLTASFLTDELGLLSPAQAERIKIYHEQLLADLDIHFKVVILGEPSSSMERRAAALFDDYALGDPTRGAKGLLLVVDPKGRQTRIATGYDLEPVFPDSFVGYLQREQMAPYYQSGQVAEGIEGTVELLVARATDPNGPFADSLLEPRVPLRFRTGGGGANHQLKPATGSTSAPQAGPGAQPSVDAAIAAYLDVLRTGNRNPDLGLYSPATRGWLRRRRVTDAQQRNELAALEAVYPRRSVRQNGQLAVVSFPDSRQVPPYFFRRDPQGWTIDLSSAARILGFDHLNRWFVREKDSEFAFGF
jgi:hypothetical protein